MKGKKKFRFLPFAPFGISFAPVCSFRGFRLLPFAPFSRLLPDKERTETNATWFGSILCCKTAKTSDTRRQKNILVCSMLYVYYRIHREARPVAHSQRQSIGAPPLDRPVAHSPAPPLDRSATTRSAPPLDRRAEDRADCGLGKHPARPRGGRAVSASRGRQVGGMILCMGGGVPPHTALAPARRAARAM